MNLMDINRVIHLAAEAGKIILQNGGETYRVEETINRICTAYGLKDADSYVTPTGIMISATDTAGVTTSLVKRIKNRTVNLEKISLVNDISRRIEPEKLEVDYVFNELEKISEKQRYGAITTLFFSAVTTSFFTLLFGGNFYDFLVAFFIGMILETFIILLSKVSINSFIINVIGGAVAALFALISVRMGLATNVDKIIIGSIMLLVPGLTITNAIRDTIAGDFVSGVSRGTDALLIAVAIAVGSGTVLKLWFSYFGGF
jgi:uncharacterized membrane protein YjjP (DUF1212 family)